MKSIQDFKIVNGVAILEGIAYAEEAKAVDDFLKTNKEIKYASVFTKDKRYFELKNDKLVLSKEEQFINPYFVQNEIKEINVGFDKEVVKTNSPIEIFDMSTLKEYEHIIYSLEEKVTLYKKTLIEIENLISTIKSL